MNTIRLTCILLAALAGTAALKAQTSTPVVAAEPAPSTIAPPAAPRARVSPHEVISLKLDNNRVTLIYGRPYSKDPKTGAIRKIWGGLVPYGKIWRTGSDEATTLTTQQAIVLGDLTVPAGTYTLFTFPTEDGGAKLVINKETGQWGVDPYHEANELGRVGLKKDTLNTTLDQFVMALEKNPAGDATLKLAWENTQFSINYTVKK